jgi:hypothetical protein
MRWNDVNTPMQSTEFKKTSDLGEINRFIGIDQRDRAKRTITLSQSPYASQIGAKHSGVDATGSKKPRKDPTVPMKPSFDVNAKGDGSNQPIQFRYLADHTRPDLLASVSIMRSGTANPHDEHVKGVRTFAEYIATSHDVGLTLGGEPEVDLFGFSDAAYLTKGDRLSRLAYCFFLNLTFKDSTLSDSSTEAELKALDEAIRQAV